MLRIKLDAANDCKFISLIAFQLECLICLNEINLFSFSKFRYDLQNLTCKSAIRLQTQLIKLKLILNVKMS